MNCKIRIHQRFHPWILAVRVFVFALVALTGTQIAQARTPVPEPAQTTPESFSYLVKQIGPSVVNIRAEKVVQTQGMVGPQMEESPFGPQDPFQEFYRRFFGDQAPREQRQQGLGSGFVIDEN